LGIKIHSVNHRLSKGFSLTGINLDIDDGEMSVIVGPNGAGKSTLLKVAAGLIKPDTGFVEVSGRDIREVSSESMSKLISYLPPSSSVMFDYTCEDIVTLGRYPYHKGLVSALDRKVVNDSMETMKIRHLAGEIIDHVSTGELKKVMIARCLALQPKVMILDEPCASLDLSASVSLMNLLKLLCGNGMSIVLSIHDVHLASKYGDKCFAMKNGREYMAGDASSVLTKNNIASLFDINEYELT